METQIELLVFVPTVVKLRCYTLTKSFASLTFCFICHWTSMVNKVVVLVGLSDSAGCLFK